MNDLHHIIRQCTKSARSFNGDTRLDGFVNPQKLGDVLSETLGQTVTHTDIRRMVIVSDVETFLLRQQSLRRKAPKSQTTRERSPYTYNHADI